MMSSGLLTSEKRPRERSRERGRKGRDEEGLVEHAESSGSGVHIAGMGETAKQFLVPGVEKVGYCCFRLDYTVNVVSRNPGKFLISVFGDATSVKYLHASIAAGTYSDILNDFKHIKLPLDIACDIVRNGELPPFMKSPKLDVQEVLQMLRTNLFVSIKLRADNRLEKRGIGALKHSTVDILDRIEIGIAVDILRSLLSVWNKFGHVRKTSFSNGAHIWLLLLVCFPLSDTEIWARIGNLIGFDQLEVMSYQGRELLREMKACKKDVRSDMSETPTKKDIEEWMNNLRKSVSGL